VVDDVAWAALTVSLMLVGGIYTWWAFRRRGLAARLRGAAFTLVPLPLLLTNTLELASDLTGSVLDWAGDLVFSLATWAGLLVAAVAVVLFVVSGFLLRRQGEEHAAPEPGAKSPDALPAAKPKRSSRVVDPVDAEMAEIEALLRKRGIT